MIVAAMGSCAGEGGLLFFLVSLNGQLDEAINEVFVGKARGLPELWVHGDAGEAGHGVDFVEIDGGFFCGCFALGGSGGLHKEVYAGEAGALAGAEGGDGHVADLFGFGGGELGGDDGLGGAGGGVLGVVVVELAVGDDLAYDGGDG